MPKSVKIRDTRRDANSTRLRPRFSGILILDDDYHIQPRQWHVDKEGYVRNGGGKALHREIMNPPPGMVIDHINGNPLDNRRENLRVCTQQQNLWNGSAHRDGVSRYRGVSWERRKSVWRVQIQGKYVGRFQSEEHAAIAYNEAAATRYGEFAKLNVVPRAGLEPARV